MSFSFRIIIFFIGLIKLINPIKTNKVRVMFKMQLLLKILICIAEKVSIDVRAKSIHKHGKHA